MKLASLFTRSEQRSEPVASSDPYLGEFFGHRGVSGGALDTERASGHAVAIAARNVIAQGLSHVPLKLYRKTDNGGREPAREHPLYKVLQDNLNPNLTAFAGREWLIQSLATHGNSPAKIERNGRGQVVALHPYDWREVTVEKLASGRLRYKAGFEVILQDDMLHLRYTTRDGVLGLSPIQVARQTFELALSHTDEATAMTRNRFSSPGAIVYPNPIGGDSKTTVISKFKERFIGASKTGEPMILDGGADFKPFAQTAKDAEFLESRKLSNLDVCRIYSVPPSAVGITDNATYSNIGEESRALVVRCLAPWAKRIEQGLNSALLTPESRKTYFIEHDLTGLLRGDLEARYKAYRVGKEWGFLSTNEIRAFENMQAVDGGDEYLSPLNMRTAGDKGITE